MINTRRLAKSFKYAASGIHHALNSDQNLVIHFIGAIIVVMASVYFRVTAFELALLVVAILLVITSEMVNTAIEKTVDLITKEHRIDAKIAKDVASGMVFVTAIGAILIGVLVFTPYIFRLFN